MNSEIHLLVADRLLSFAHISLVFFNLFGWLHPRTRKWNLLTLALTAVSWFLLGIWYGLGYCPLTDWQWQVREQMGDSELPHSFVKFSLDYVFSRDFDPVSIDRLTGFSFASALLASVVTNVRDFRKRRNRREPTVS